MKVISLNVLKTMHWFKIQISMHFQHQRHRLHRVIIAALVGKLKTSKHPPQVFFMGGCGCINITGKERSWKEFLLLMHVPYEESHFWWHYVSENVLINITPSAEHFWVDLGHLACLISQLGGMNNGIIYVSHHSFKLFFFRVFDFILVYSQVVDK